MALKNFNAGNEKNKLSLKGFAKEAPKNETTQKNTPNIKNNGYKEYVDTVKSGGNGKAVLSSFGKPQIKTPFNRFKEEQRRHIEYITPQMARSYADIVAKTHRLTISDVEKQGILEEATRALIRDAKDRMHSSDLDKYKEISRRFEKSRDIGEHENLFRQLQGMEYRKRKAEDYFIFDRERDIQKGIIAKENRNIEKYQSQLDKLNREQFTPEKGIINRDALKEKYGIEKKGNGEEKVLTGNERFDNILYSGAFEDAAGRARRAQLQSEYFERQLKPFEKIRNEINEPGGKEILQRRYQNDMAFRNEFDNLIKKYQQFAKVAPTIENNFNEAVKEYESEVNISNKKAVMGERNYTIEKLTKEALGILEFSKASEEGREKAKKQGWELPEAMPRYVNGEYIPHSMDDSFSENEQNIYYALFNVNPQKAAQYRKALTERYTEDWHNEATEKIINNPLSAGLTLAVSDILKYPEAVINTITGGKLGASGYKGFGELSNRIKGNMIKNSDGAGRKIIETGLGIGDMLAAQIAAGGKGVKIASALMGTNAASSAMDSARARGGNEVQIYASGVAAGTIEYLLNKLGTERLLNMIGKPSRSILKAMVTNGVSEFAEEFLTEVAQNLSDIGIMGNKSQLSNYINSLIQSGMGEDDAKKTAIKDMFLNQPFDSGIVGFLTGSIMGGGNAAISTVSEGFEAVKNPNKFINYTDSIINSDVSSLSGEAEKLRGEVERYRNKAKNSKHTLGTLINSGKAMAAAGEFSSIPKVIVQREGLQKSERTFLERLSKITKANIIYTEIPNAIGETGVLKGGIFSAGDNTILIDYRTSAADILKFVAGHEAGHSSEGTKWHNALKNFVKSEMGEEYENEVSKKIETHKKAGNILNRIDAENEVVSDYAGKVLSEEGVAERMAKRDYGTAKLFLDSIKDIGNKIKTSFGAESASGIEEGARLLERALGMRTAQSIKMNPAYIITEIKSDTKNYGEGVFLDTDIFSGIHPRNWDKTLRDFVHNNLAGKVITVFNDDGTQEKIYFAKSNERVLKDGANNSHKVIDKLARQKGSVNALMTVHIDEVLDVAEYVDENTENSHQWLDSNGWDIKKVYVQTIKGDIYESTLNIAKTRDGRNLMYAFSNTKRVDGGDVPSTENGRGSHTAINSYDIVAQSENDVKGKVQNSVTELTPEQQDAIKKVETEGKKVSEFYKNSLQKEIVEPAVKETDGPEGHTYKPVSNKTTYEKGKAYVNSIGIEAARAEIEDKFTEGIPLTSEEVGRAEYIFTQLQNSGDTMGTVRFAEMWNRSVTEGARALQALQILDKLTPEGRFLYVTREAERNTEKQIKELKGKRKAAFEKEVAEAKVKDKERQKREKAAAKAEEDFGVYAGLLTGDKIDAEYLKEIERLNEELKKNRQKYEDIKRQLQKEKREGENEERQEKTNDAGDGTLKKRERGKVKDKEDGVESDTDGLEVEAAKYRERIKRLEKKLRELSPKKSKKKEKPEYEKVLEKYGIDHMGEEDKKFVSDVLQTIDKLDTQKDLIDIILEQNEKRGRVNPKWLRKSLMRNDVALLKDTAWHQVIRMVQDKKKESFVKKISSLRIMAMLLNGRTFSRNMISNLCFNGIDATATNIAVVFDSLIAPFTKNRTVAYDKRGFGKGGLKVINEARRKSATEIVLDLQPGENKYGLGRKAVFKNRPMAYLERLMGYSLTTTDEMSKEGIKRSIRNGLLKLKEKGKCNFTEEQIEEISDEVAKYRTFQDENGVSKAILRIKDALNTAGVRKGNTSFGLGDFVLPFAQVPGAIVMRSLEFSPVGYLKTLSIISDIRQNGELSAEGQRKLSLALGRASTGTGLTLLFGFLAKIGLIKGSSDDEEQDSKAKALEKEQGLSGFKLNASGLKRVLGAILSSKSIKEAAKPREGDNLMQYDFLEPISNNMAVGFAWAQADEGFVDVAAISTAKFFEQIMDTTGFDTIKMILDPEKSTMEKVITFAVDTGTSFIPQVVKQTGGFFDKSARNAYNENGAGKIALSRLLSGIPGARNTLPAKINPFGGEVSNTTGNEVFDFLNAYINPGTISKYHSNKVIDEVQHLYKEIGVGRFLPNDIRSGKEISVGEGIKINLYGKTFEEYKKKVGKSLYKEYEVILGTDIYKNASIEEKGELLEDVKNKVLDRIKYEIARDNGLINDVVIDTKLDVKTRKDYLNSIKVFYPEDVSKNFEAADMESAYGFIKYLEKENSLTGESAQAINKYLKERQKSEEYQSLKKILLDNCNAAESFAPLVRNYENIFSWSKNGQKYKLEIKPDEVVKIMKVFDTYVYSTYEKLYKDGYYTEKSGMGKVTNANGKKVNATWNNMSAEQRNAKLSDYRSRCIKSLRKVLGTQKNYKVTKEE